MNEKITYWNGKLLRIIPRKAQPEKLGTHLYSHSKSQQTISTIFPLILSPFPFHSPYQPWHLPLAVSVEIAEGELQSGGTELIPTFPKLTKREAFQAVTVAVTNEPHTRSHTILLTGKRERRDTHILNT